MPALSVPPERLPTQARLLELFRYDPDTGHLIRRIARGDQPAGSIAGTLGRGGYIKVKVDKITLLAHRVIWKMQTDEWPPEVDHRDGVRSNNRWRNLRSATTSQNRHNRAMSRTNTSGLMGATRTSDKRRWRAAIGLEGRKIYLGNFPTAEAAHAAYVEAKARLHPFQPTVRS